MTEALINLEIFNRFLESVNGDIDFLDEMLETFFKDSPRQIEDMHTALKASNYEDLMRAAHSLKANSAVFGAGVLSAQCKHLEGLAKSGAIDAQDAAQYINRIEEAYQLACLELKRIRAAMF